MGMIKAEDITVGMVLAADLHSPQGRLLLHKGTVVADNHMRIFKIWGVCEANIEGGSSSVIDDEKLTRITPEKLSLAKSLLARLFVYTDLHHEAVAELARIFLMRSCNSSTEDLNRLLLEYPSLTPKKKKPVAAAVKNPTISLDQIVNGNVELVSLPDIFMQITDAINNPRSSATYVADIISKDISISAKLLKLVNSAFYGFPSEISTHSRAITVIGTSQLSTLALGVSVTTMFQGIPEEFINMKHFWRHSLICGLAARLLAAKLTGFDEERFFVAGLLHDIGRLIICKNYPEQAQKALTIARVKSLILDEAERTAWGFSHGSIAGEILRNWNFPAVLENSVRYHHLPRMAKSMIEPGIIHLADIIAHVVSVSGSGKSFIPPLEPLVWDLLGFSKSVLAQVIDQVDYQMEELEKIFFTSDE